MEVIVANVDHIKFDIDYALEQQYGALPLPFPGMDSKSIPRDYCLLQLSCNV